MTVTNLYVLATQIKLLFGGESQTGESPAPYFCSTLEMLLGSVLPCALEQGLSLPGMQEPAHLLCAHPDSKCRTPPGGALLLPVGVVQALLGWAVTLLSSNRNRISHQLPDGIPSPCPNTHTHAGWPLLPCVTLPCSAGAGVAVCKLLCSTCTVSLSYLSTGCFS